MRLRRAVGPGRSAQEVAPLLAPCDPAERQQSALGVEAGRIGREAIVNPLAGQAEDSGESDLFAAPPEERDGLAPQFVSERRARPGAQRVSDMTALRRRTQAPSGRRRTLEKGERQLGRQLHLRRDSGWVEVHRGGGRG